MPLGVPMPLGLGVAVAAALAVAVPLSVGVPLGRCEAVSEPLPLGDRVCVALRDLDCVEDRVCVCD